MAPKLLYLVTEDWYFVSHRLPMARAALNAGFEVHVATRVSKHGGVIASEGFVVHPLAWERGRFDPLHLTLAISEVRSLYRALRPAVAHHVALAPTVIGSLAAAGLSFPRLNALAGLGFAFTSKGVKAAAMRLVLQNLLRLLLRNANAVALVQNPDDRRALEQIGISAEKIALIPGSGVDADRLQPLPDPAGPVTAAFVGRLLYDKGLAVLIDAVKLLQARQKPIRLIVAGEVDPANPASIPDKLVSEWKAIPGVDFRGHVGDIRTVWRDAHIAVLPSRREGLPLSLLEAAACGRPLVATDVPGCREVARPGVNALLVPPDDAPALSNALARLAEDRDLRVQLGQASRKLVEATFSSGRIQSEIVALYRHLLEPKGLPAKQVADPAAPVFRRKRHKQID
jgi:glycosyltransferase involved in cell wall biosynthesis